MTVSPNSLQKSPYKVVTPVEDRPQPPAPVATSPATPTIEETSEEATPGQTHALRHLIRWSVLIGGVALAGLIPTPYQVGGEVELEWLEGDRQQVRAPMRAVVEGFYVAPGDVVNIGDPIVRLSSRELDGEIAALEAEIARAQQVLAEAEQDQIQAEATLAEVSALADITRERANRLANRNEQATQGILPPDIAMLTVARDRLADQLSRAASDQERYQMLYNRGAIALVELHEKEDEYLNIERDLNAKKAEIQYAQQRLEDDAVDEIGNANYQQASFDAAATVASAKNRIQAQQQAIVTYQSRLATLNQQQAELVLTAEKSGTVLDDDLDLIIGQEVSPDSDLLRIAKLGKLTANVEVKEEDLNYFNEGSQVTFRPTSAKLITYDAEVDKILHDLEPDQTQQRRLATVRLIINNDDQRLRPGSGGYAKIFSEWIPLYQRLGREILKLVPSKFL